MKHTAPILALLAITFTARAADEWPQFRGPTGQGISDAKNVPIEWSGTEHVAWTTEIPGKGWSSPVLSKGRLYVTTAIGEKGSEVSLRALCLDAKDGRILWDTEIFKPEATVSSVMHKKNSLASPSPIVTADRLYVHFGHMGTAALDLAGKIVWKQDTEAAYMRLSTRDPPRNTNLLAGGVWGSGSSYRWGPYPERRSVSDMSVGKRAAIGEESG